MKTYVVNMTKDTEKRAQIESQLANHTELEYQIWKAVEGRKLTVQEQKEMIHPEFYERYGRTATLPVAGCSLSHLSIYRDILESQENVVLILEDDAVILPREQFDITKLKKIIDSENPMALLLTSDFWYYKDNCKKVVDSFHRIYEIESGYMTSGYLINRAAAKILATNLLPIKYKADEWEIFIGMGIEVLGIVPHVISFPDGVGEIGKSTEFERQFALLRKIAIFFYVRLLWSKKYLSGLRISKKRWK